MPDYVYVKVLLAEGRLDAWSSGRGRLKTRKKLPWNEMFSWIKASEPQAKVMIHLLGDNNLVDDEARLTLMERARWAGFTVVRFEEGSPMDPEEAFQMLQLPFT